MVSIGIFLFLLNLQICGEKSKIHAMWGGGEGECHRSIEILLSPVREDFLVEVMSVLTLQMPYSKEGRLVLA